MAVIPLNLVAAEVRYCHRYRRERARMAQAIRWGGSYAIAHWVI